MAFGYWSTVWIYTPFIILINPIKDICTDFTDMLDWSIGLQWDLQTKVRHIGSLFPPPTHGCVIIH